MGIIDRQAVPIPTTVSFLLPDCVDPAKFERILRASPLFVSPATSADEFANQVEVEVTKVLDRLAPLRRCNRRRPSHAGCLPMSFLPSGTVVRLNAAGARPRRKSAAFSTAVHADMPTNYQLVSPGSFKLFADKITSL
jgi:hypothetical protein